MAALTPPAMNPEPGFGGPRRLDGSFDALLDVLWVTERKNVMRRKIPREKRPRVKANRRLEMRLKASFQSYPFEEDFANPASLSMRQPPQRESTSLT